MAKLTTQQVCELAKKLDGVSEKVHFGKDAFIANGRIFATVWHDKNRVTLMLNEEQQKSFLLKDGSEGFIQINNAWGKDAIGIDLDSVDSDLFFEALEVAWINSANKRSVPKRKATSSPRIKTVRRTRPAQSNDAGKRMKQARGQSKSPASKGRR